MAGQIARDKAIVAVQEIALETVIGHLRDVAKLHKPTTEERTPWDCYQGNCDHEHECPEVMFTLCVECTNIREDGNDEGGCVGWPCSTIDALGGAELVTKLTEEI